MKYVYFVSYAHGSPEIGSGFGHQEVNSSEPIITWEHIEAVTRFIESLNETINSVIIINFQLLRREVDGDDG
jgi:hypothetical protein